MPVVSVIMVFHRDTRFLRRAIASVLGQTLTDLELVLVDNGTGLSADALGGLGGDARLRWVRLESNFGIAAGHNAGVAAARADFVALLDYDDLMLPHRLARQVELLCARPGLGLVGAGAATIDENDRTVGREFCLIDEQAHRVYSAYHSGAIMPSFAGRTEVFRTFAYRPAFRWSSDFDFVSRAAERYAISAVPEVLLHYRRYPDQTTQCHRTEQIRDECWVRLLTARRRAGRDEGFDAAAVELQQNCEVSAEPCALHAEFGAHFLAERFAAQAAYEARRILAMSRAPGAVVAALRLWRRGLAVAPGDAIFLSRIFFTGPVRAHGLRNAAALMPDYSGCRDVTRPSNRG